MDNCYIRTCFDNPAAKQYLTQLGEIMSLTAHLLNLPLCSPTALPPEHSEIVILCPHNDIKYIPDVFSNYKIRLIISNTPPPHDLEQNKNLPIATDIAKILDFQTCYLVVFCSQPDFDVLHWAFSSLEKIKIKYANICIPLPRSMTTVSHHNPRFFEKYKNELETVYSLLADQESKNIFASRIRSIITGNIGYIQQSDYPQYFYPPTAPQPGDVILDGGVSGNISVEQKFSEIVGERGHIYAFEPEPVCYFQAEEKAKNIKNITLLPLGMWNKCEKVTFLSEGPGSHVVYNNKEDNCVICHMTTIDTIVSQYNIDKVDMIKLDVEGSEEKALLGGIKTIVRHRPKLLISLYHNSNDIFELPLFVKKLNLNYKFYLGHHRPSLQETVLYALPG